MGHYSTVTNTHKTLSTQFIHSMYVIKNKGYTINDPTTVHM